MSKRRINPEAVARARKPERLPKEKPGMHKARNDVEWDWWDSRVGRDVVVRTAQGRTLVGTLKFVATFSVCVIVNRREVLIMKNSIESAETDTPKAARAAAAEGIEFPPERTHG